MLLFFSLISIPLLFFFFFFNDTATTEIYTLSLHDALPICIISDFRAINGQRGRLGLFKIDDGSGVIEASVDENTLNTYRSEEHTSELQSHSDLVCRLLLEKKKKPQARKTQVGHR